MHTHKFLGQHIDLSDPATFAAHTVAHLASLSAIGSIAMHYLPLVYGVFPAMYYAALFVGTPVVQKWLRQRRVRKGGPLTGRRAKR